MADTEGRTASESTPHCCTCEDKWVAWNRDVLDKERDEVRVHAALHVLGASSGTFPTDTVDQARTFLSRLLGPTMPKMPI